MPEQSNSHAQILKEADAYLSKNDVTNYWLTIEKICPLYGRVAGDLARVFLKINLLGHPG